jgi:hypothetical protein
MQKDDRIFAIVGACVVAAAAVIAATIWLSTGITVDEPQRAAVVVPLTQAPAPTASEAPSADLDTADAGVSAENAIVRTAVARLSAHPQFAAFLVTDRLLVRFVMVVDAVAGGYSPREQVEFLRPPSPFLVRETDGRLVATAGSFRRYDLAAEVLDSIDIDGAVDLYRRFEPQLEAIYEEIGWAGEDFDSRLREAIDHLLEVERLSGPFELEQRTVVYAYADDHIEQLSDAQKHLLRMGPGNARRLLAQMHDFREAMGWPVRALEQPDDDVLEVAVNPGAPIVTADASPMWTGEDIDDRVGATQAP